MTTRTKKKRERWREREREREREGEEREGEERKSLKSQVCLGKRKVRQTGREKVTKTGMKEGARRVQGKEVGKKIKGVPGSERKI